MSGKTGRCFLVMLLLALLCTPAFAVYADENGGGDHVDYWFEFGECSMLPDWDQDIQNQYDCKVFNSTWPDGRDYKVTVTGVSSEDTDVVSVEQCTEDGNPNNVWWKLRAENYGDSLITVTYTDWDGTTGCTEEFICHVSHDVYRIDLWTEDGSFNVLPGGTIRLETHGQHERRDPDTDDYQYIDFDEMQQASVVWRVDEDSLPDDLAGTVAVTADPADVTCATVSFPSSDDWDEDFGFDVRVVAELTDDGQPVAERDIWLHLHTNYMEVWPTRIDGDLDVGGTLVITPELREYPADNADGYTVLTGSKTNFRMETDDDNAAEVTEQDDGTFLLQRHGDWDTNVRLIAERKNSQGSFEEVCRVDYHLNHRNYDIWYEIWGDDSLYTDGSRTYNLNTGNLTDSCVLQASVGTGRWDEDEGCFETSLEEGDGWMLDAENGALILDGSALSAKQIGRVETRIAVLCNGIEVEAEYRGFDVRDAWYWLDQGMDGEVLFKNDERYLSKEGNIQVNDSCFPEGNWHPRMITALTWESDERDYDTRDAVQVTEDENGWSLRGVRSGETTFHAVVQITDYDSDRTEEIEKTFTVHVGGRRVNLDLRPVGGKFEMYSGSSLAVRPFIQDERQNMWTGERWNEDVSGLTVQHEVWLNWIDQWYLDRYFDGDYDRAQQSILQNCLTWSADDNNVLTLTTTTDAPEMEIQIHTMVLDPEENERQVADSWRNVINSPARYAIICDEDLDPDMPAGAEMEIMPRLYSVKYGQEPEEAEFDVEWVLEWYPGEEGNPDNIPHFVITDADGKTLRDGMDSGKPPFTVRRMAEWDVNLKVYACRDGVQNAYSQQTFWCSSQDYRISFSNENGHAVDNYTMVFNGEGVQIGVDTSFTEDISASCQSGITRELVMDFYDYFGEPVTLPAGAALTASELSVENGLSLSAARVQAILDALYAAYPESEGFTSVLEASVSYGNTLLARESTEVDFMEEGSFAFRGKDRGDWDVRASLLPTESLDYPGGEALYFLCDPDHCDRNYLDDRIGSYFDVHITDIHSSDPSVLLPGQNGEDWILTAQKPGAADITWTFTGGPAGPDTEMTYQAGMAVRSSALALDLVIDGRTDQEYEFLVGEEVPYEIRVVRKTWDAAAGEVRTEIPEENVYDLPDDSSFDLGMNYDRNMMLRDTDSEGNPVFRITGEGECILGVQLRSGDQFTNRRIHIYANVAIPQLDYDDSLVLDVTPGQTLSAADLAGCLPQTMRIASMRHPEGEVIPVEEYWFNWANEGFTLNGIPEDHSSTSVTVSNDALDYQDGNGIYETRIGFGAAANWVETYGSLRVRVRKVNALPKPLAQYDVLTLPAGTKVVEPEAFAGTAAEVAVIPAGCEKICPGAFANCPNLEYVIVDSLDEIWIMDGAFIGSQVTVLDNL